MEDRKSVAGPAIVIIAILIVSHVMTIFTLVNIRQQIDTRMDRLERFTFVPGGPWVQDRPPAVKEEWTPDENGNVKFEGSGTIGFETPKALTPGTVVYPMYDKAGKLLYVESGEPHAGQVYVLRDGKWVWVPATWNSTKGDWEVKKEK